LLFVINPISESSFVAGELSPKVICIVGGGIMGGGGGGGGMAADNDLILSSGLWVLQ
jgi:hypothetical protein